MLQFAHLNMSFYQFPKPFSGINTIVAPKISIYIYCWQFQKLQKACKKYNCSKQYQFIQNSNFHNKNKNNTYELIQRQNQLTIKRQARNTLFITASILSSKRVRICHSFKLGHLHRIPIHHFHFSIITMNQIFSREFFI